MTTTKGIVTKALLNFLVGLGESTVELGKLWSALADGYGRAYRRGGCSYVAELRHFENQAALARKVKELARRRYITVRRHGTKFIVTITDKGYTATFVEQLKHAPAHRRGWYTIVTFDIPEELSHERKRLRMLLREGGFIKLQQSVWVSRNDNYQLLAAFIKHGKLTRWINVFRARDFLN